MLVLSSSQSAGGRNPSPFPDHSLSAQTTPTQAAAEVKRCLRCGVLYRDEDNSSTAYAFHGHTTCFLPHPSNPFLFPFASIVDLPLPAG
ncbi:hypothetical protein MA16_Dca016472 [Dendrobium catenatum]|uniref:Uncharacterized protein n=1 Tax=Dendrobium catenatum TaxID=906689 RepID=A0A2I0VYR5_9ASPA|nr:hypothetical protein MA16_Dca016472 [Dendrobium catenatum]